ncbi:hypothetical protein CI109_101868 [Kwoniella shandongensis]|uniref:Uncharacterized protein n=1 Tax=Kwoniella shandongensis TaxID=1734106 RepID=A0A5M6BUD9_9TREE|nr:uncharacterized protein CI109_007054 [Kwoniella shandongensis]KAA5524619.1 hypothetical protein CI109_007054 [Kwoniella shandongensis]
MGRFSEFIAGSSSHENGNGNGNGHIPPPPNYNDSKVPFATEPKYPTEPPPPFPHLFACLHLGRTDRVRLIGVPQNVIPAVDEAIKRVWLPGIQQQGPYTSGWEWKVSGNPWQGFGIEAITARRLLSHILHALSAVGWDIHMSCDLSKKSYDKDTIFLHSVPPRQRYYFAISFNESDKIRIIDPPNDYVRDAFIRAVHTWPAGIQQEREKEPGCYQLKLRGYPWFSSDGTQIVEARLLACTILSAMESVGFELVSSVDMSTASENNRDLDTWYFASKV